MNRRAKIVATIGPSSKNIIEKLILAGMDVARLNFSHGTHEEYVEIISTIRNVSTKLNKPITIMQDLQGPKLRVGNLPAEGVKLIPDQIVFMASVSENMDIIMQDPSSILIPFEIQNLKENLSNGKRILLDDGSLEIEVIDNSQKYIKARVITGGLLFSHKGVNFPGITLNIPGFTMKDKEDLIFGIEQNIDIVALSFINSASDIQLVKDEISKHTMKQTQISIIAKLELPKAIENLDSILNISDGVMIARGDLAVETSLSKVPILQKNIIRAANNQKKIVITATQMLDSMIKNPMPTRAEASDVANAIFDGSDALMLSGETANGIFPEESIKMMDAIICEAETHIFEWGICQNPQTVITTDDAVSLTWATHELAHDLNVKGIAIFTETGRTARLMAKTRPQVPIFAFTPNLKTFNSMGIIWGVIPQLVPFASSVESMLSIVDEAFTKLQFINAGDQVILLCGFPVGSQRPANLALLHTIGESFTDNRL